MVPAVALTRRSNAMKLDPQIPIGKAKSDMLNRDHAEVSGHGLFFDTGEPAVHVAPDAEEPAEDELPEAEGHRRMLDHEHPSEGETI
jgi:hypothetical protein